MSVEIIKSQFHLPHALSHLTAAGCGCLYLTPPIKSNNRIKQPLDMEKIWFCQSKWNCAAQNFKRNYLKKKELFAMPHHMVPADVCITVTFYYIIQTLYLHQIKLPLSQTMRCHNSIAQITSGITFFSFDHKMSMQSGETENESQDKFRAK